MLVEIKRQLRPALVALAFFSILLGLAYPVAITGIAGPGGGMPSGLASDPVVVRRPGIGAVYGRRDRARRLRAIRRATPANV